MKWAAVVAVLMGAVGCVGQPRFADQPPVWRALDRDNVPEPPEASEYWKYREYPDIFVMRPLERLLLLPDHEPAHNVNALEEVPSSTWFENRIGVRRVTPEELQKGASEGPPVPPYVVTEVKSEGTDPGFLLKDGADRKFLVKFDEPGHPEMLTGNGVIANRIFWALGYHVPSDNLFVFHPSELVLDPEATYKDVTGDEKLLTHRYFDEVLEQAPRTADGRVRTIASQWLDGEPLGGFAEVGVRDGDPNDTIPHQHRRELRGLRVFSAWLAHTDMTPANTLDMYVEEGGEKFVKHYLIDFGETLGGHKPDFDPIEYEHLWDWSYQPRSLLALGLWKRPWEVADRENPYPAIGNYAGFGFDPEIWKEQYPYLPFDQMDAADAFWAAKLVMRFRRDLIEAAVATGELSDPAASAYLVDAIDARRKIIGVTYFEQVTPLDRFRIEPGRLCAVDLSMYYGFVRQGSVDVLDEDGDVARSAAIGARGRICLRIPDDEEYRIVRVRVRRGDDERPPMQIHYKGGSRARILGIIRLPDKVE